ncbi:DNA-processing protein DprA [Desulfurobacterium indicum]|uniref:DNA protecting protein DprA n=1 Tax=Desulfurobacterium indicum TaxID=1914305 RepID=A0A1R1MKB3_9BACT|nr:DNA-processing protein DprA [Desulfurobacterium indicum]OMH40203.1 DNA protecting protein DprA [Desulfurobacterium indicum]
METLYALAFYFKKGIGLKTIKKFIDKYGSFEAASKAEGLDLKGELLRAEKEIKTAEKLGVKLFPLTGKGYPPILKKISSPPPVLYVKGKLDFNNSMAVSIVGSRRCSSYGRKIAYQLASFLSSNGVPVISGLAYGIDTAAHKGAVESKGVTYAVLGCGIDVNYPSGNSSLREIIVDSGGALISEFPFGTSPSRENFPRRNRIISGLSVATVVVEANENSGALITAGFALDEGRDVFAVPANIDSVFSKGSNKLLKEGAVPLVEFEDIFEEIPYLRKRRDKAYQREIDEKFQPIVDVLLKGDAHIDKIVAESGLPYCEVITLLFELEAEGVVKSDGNRYFLIQGGNFEKGRD